MTRTALVTGASAGLGAEFASQLAGTGINLVLVARRKEKLESVAKALREKYQVEVATVSGDLSDPDTPRNLFDFVHSKNIEIDYLINNAGSGGPHLFEEPEWAPQAQFLELMMTSITHMCHHFIPPMRKRGFGRVLNVASVAGRLPRDAGGHYGPSKAYVIALSEELALVLSKTGVNVSALCPGFTHTDFHQAADLAAMKDSLPGFLWYSAETVVREGLAAVEKGKPIMISGRLYRWLDPLMQSVFTRSLIKAFSPGRETDSSENR